jgi:hypothetical protein
MPTIEKHRYFTFLISVSFAQTKTAVDPEGAIDKKQVDGDLKAVIAAYRKTACKNAEPGMCAKALMHLESCYEKLGRQAQTVYRQIMALCAIEKEESPRFDVPGTGTASGRHPSELQQPDGRNNWSVH